MKICYFSDLHIMSEQELNTLFSRIKDQVEEQSPDMILCPGDFSNIVNPHIIEKFKELEEIAPYYWVPGNHDFYRSITHPYQSEPERYEIDNQTILVAGTMWTNYFSSNEREMSAYEGMLNDCLYIAHWSAKLALKEFNKFKFFLEETIKLYPNKNILVLTHHGPSKKSVSPQFLLSNCNGSFVNDLDQFILDNPQIKLWVHGHVHQTFDYEIGNCRVVCHPRGYPREENYSNYYPKFIEL